jgi:VanZ family protein
VTLFVWSTVGYLRAVSEWLRAHGLLRAFIAVASLLCAAGFLAEWNRLAHVPIEIRRKSFGVLFVGTLLYAVAMQMLVIAPEERMHFVVGGLVTFLFYRAIDSLTISRTKAIVGAWLAGSLVGIVEETLQLFCKGRTFDLRDIGLNVLAAFLVAALIRFALVPLKERT